MEAKVKCQQEADATGATISLANRLVGGLASEKVPQDPIPGLDKSVGALGQFRQTAERAGGHDAWRCSPRCFLHLLCWMFHQTIQGKSLYININTFELRSTSWIRNGSHTSL